MSATIRNAYDRPGVAEHYADRRFRCGSGQRTHALEASRLRRLLQAAPTAHRVLDLPCGTGRFAAFFPHANVIAADLSLAMLSAASKAYHNPALLLSKAECLPFQDRTFDLVFCVRLLHHFDSAKRRAALIEFARVSSSYALVSIYLGPSLQGARRRWKQARGAVARSRRTIAKAEFHRDLEASGWEIEARLPLRRWISESWYYLLRKNACETHAPRSGS